ncbi:MAG: NADAR family protein [Ktedonobacteraceae bacterium]
MTIYFYAPRENPYGCFSNFSRHGVTLDDLWWPTTEHYFQAQKFAGTPFTESVRSATSPKLAAEIGRDRKLPLRTDWEAVKDTIMLKAVQCKFETHAQLRDILLSTGDEEIIENAPRDYYWGCGADGSGKNQLGQTLMLVRTTLHHNR